MMKAKNYFITCIAIVLIGFFSFYLNYYYVTQNPINLKSTIFYLPWFRVFEFSIGAIGVYLARIRFAQFLQELMCITGLGIIIYSLLVLSEGVIFPYLNALPPCFGALLIILSKDSCIAKLLLKNKISIYVGVISYSLYLVHWPVLVFAKYTNLSVNKPFVIFEMLVISLAVAVISYHYVEKPFRYSQGLNKARVIKFLLTMSLVLFFVGLSIKVNGWQWRYTKIYSEHRYSNPNDEDVTKLLSIEDINAGKSARYTDIHTACTILTLENTDRCHLDRPIQILILGNSHEPDGFNIFMRLYGNNPLVNIIVFGSTNDCSVVINETDFSSSREELGCKMRFATLASKDFSNRLTHIVYSSHSGFDQINSGHWRILSILHDQSPNIKLIALGSYLATSMDCATLKNKYGSYDACRSKDVVTYFSPNEKALSPLPETKELEYLYINKYQMLCKDEQLKNCVTHIKNEPMFYDEHHLSYPFARYIGELIGIRYREDLIKIGLPDPKISEILN